MISQQEGPFGFVDPADSFGWLELNQRITGFVFNIFPKEKKALSSQRMSQTFSEMSGDVSTFTKSTG